MSGNKKAFHKYVKSHRKTKESAGLLPNVEQNLTVDSAKTTEMFNLFLFMSLFIKKVNYLMISTVSGQYKGGKYNQPTIGK